MAFEAEPGQKIPFPGATPFETEGAPAKGQKKLSGHPRKKRASRERAHQLNRISAVSNIVLASVAVGVVLYYTKFILIPFTIALFLGNIATPTINYFKARLHVPRLVSVGVMFLVTGAILAGFAYPMTTILDQMLNDIQIYREKLDTLLASAALWLQNRGVDVSPGDIAEAVGNLPYSSYIGNVASQIADLLVSGIMVVVFFILLTIGRSHTPSPKVGVMAEVDARIRRYLVIKLLVSAATGVLVGGFLAYLGVELALFLGLITFVLNFIPTIGSIFATLLLVPVALFHVGDLVQFFAIIGIPAGVQFIIGTILEPKYQGNTLDLHPVTVLIALMFWGLIWGPAGMFLGVPLTAIFKLILEKFPGTRWITDLFSGRIAEAELLAPTQPAE